MTLSRRVKMLIAALAVAAAAAACGHAVAAEPRYAWLTDATPYERLLDRFPPPAGFTRLPAEPASFAQWLRHLPLKTANAPVKLHDGRLKPRQDVHAAVIEIDVGSRDLQQCADAIMRLRAEFLFSRGRLAEIGFNATGGDRLAFARWAAGERPRVTGSRIAWRPGAPPDQSHGSLRRYLDVVFAYAGTYSLAAELKAVPMAQLAPGDVLIKGGFPGHAVIVLDVAVDPTGAKRYLLAQSFMPAQDIHVVRNPASADGSAWYDLAADAEVVTPEWTFARASLKRFP